MLRHIKAKNYECFYMLWEDLKLYVIGKWLQHYKLFSESAYSQLLLVIFSNSNIHKLKHQHIHTNKNPTQTILVDTTLSHGLLPKAFLLTSIYTGLSLSIPLPWLPSPQPSRKIQCRERIKWKMDTKVIVKPLDLRLELLRRFNYKCWIGARVLLT